MRSSATSGS
jgi:hypothetical protein